VADKCATTLQAGFITVAAFKLWLRRNFHKHHKGGLKVGETQTQEKINRNLFKSVEVETQPLYLSGICRCGRRFNVYVELPKTCEATDESGNHFKLSLAEHIIALCPSCGRLVNIGNGTRRQSKAREF
jgi:hypothetical protein